MGMPKACEQCQGIRKLRSINGCGVTSLKVQEAHGRVFLWSRRDGKEQRGEKKKIGLGCSTHALRIMRGWELPTSYSLAFLNKKIN